MTADVCLIDLIYCCKMKLIYLLFFPFVLFSCEKSDFYTENCGVSLEHSAGLRVVKAEIEEYSCITNIYSGSLDGKSVYITSVVDPACLTNGSLGVYNCEGEFLDNLQPNNSLKVGELLADNRSSLK